MEKKAVLAVVLSILVLMLFQHRMVRPYPQEKTGANPQPFIAEPKTARGAAPEEAALPYEAEEEYTVETGKFILTFSNLGGSIKKIGLKEFIEKDSGRPLEFMTIKSPAQYTGAFNLTDYAFQDGAAYQLTRSEDKIIYKNKTRNIEVEKIYSTHNTNDYIDLQIILHNTSNSGINTGSRLAVGAGINAADPLSQRYVNVSSKVNGRLFADRRNLARDGDVSWVSLNSKYFCILVKPYQLARRAVTSVQEKANLSAAIETGAFDIPPLGEITQRYLIFVGPLEIRRLKALRLGLEEAVNYGIFDGISKLLSSTLRFFYKIVRNWGLAIICVTILINLILYPLTRKSYKSMKAMQELQPHIDKLRGIHKDNPQRLNKELVELYKRFNINPLGGCLPLLFQMPIFIALYHALVRSLELKDANFLWINDLSMPDAVKLPLSLPIVGRSINILPIFMMIAMIIQQKISTNRRPQDMSEQEKQQQNIMLMMPVIFVIIFYTLPSGLVLYWLVNTLLMSFYQYRLKKASTGIVVG